MRTSRNCSIAKLSVVGIALAIGSGCASVTRGTVDVLEVNTTPAQAEIRVYRIDRGYTETELKKNLPSEEVDELTAQNEGKDKADWFAGPLTAKSPASFTLARKGEYRVEIAKDGYAPASVDIRNEVSGGGSAGMAGNVLVGGLIGAGVDAGSGAMLDLTPNPVELELEAVDAVSDQPEDTPVDAVLDKLTGVSE
ncbi:MAG: hypothetical protein AAFX44_04400 [Pseudomonadota bacterium]